ncbi:PucR family transcriptional regulator [Clostridium sp. DL1XJH146]
MGIKVETIYEHFMVITNKTNINDKIEYTSLYEAKLIVKGQKKFKKDILYVGKCSFVKENDIILTNGSFILIDDLVDFDTDFYIKEAVYIILKNNYDIFELFNEVNDLFNSNVEALNSSYSLLSSLLDNKGLNDMVRLSSEILDNPVIIIDSSYRIIASSDTKEINDNYWIENIKKGYCSYDYISYVRKIKSFKESPNNMKPFVVICDKSPIERWLCKIFIHGKLAGYIVLLLTKSAMQEKYKEILPMIANVVSKELERTEGRKNINNIDYENLLRDILDHNIKDADSLNEKLKSYNYKFKNKYFLLTFDIRDYNAINKSPRYLSSNLEGFFHNKPSIYYEDYIVILYDFEEKHFISLYTEEKYEELERFVDTNNIFLGISKEFEELLDLRENFDHTVKTIEIAKKLNKDKNINLYKDIQFYDFISQAQKTVDIQNFFYDDLNILLEYDKKNKTEFYDTLYVYLKNNQNIVVSAKELYIHRNTMKYRLGKIVKLTNIDFENEEQMFQLYFSIKVKHFLD